MGDSYIRGDRGAVSAGMLMDQTIRENMSKNRPKIPGKCRQCRYHQLRYQSVQLGGLVTKLAANNNNNNIIIHA